VLLISRSAERDAAAHLLSFFPDLPEEFTIDTYLDLRRAGQDAKWPHVQPLPGVRKLIHHLHKHKIPMAVATGSQRRNFELKSAHLIDDVFGPFDGKVICADDGYLKPGRGKPHPDIFLITAKQCLGREVGEGEESESHLTEGEKLERAKGLVFEDAIPGLQAGKRAGMKVVWVPDPEIHAIGTNGSGNILEQADLVLTSIEEFVPEEWGLPAYEPGP